MSVTLIDPSRRRQWVVDDIVGVETDWGSETTVTVTYADGEEEEFTGTGLAVAGSEIIDHAREPGGVLSGLALPYVHPHDGDEPHDVICPSCGEQGFDGRGHVTVEGTRMYLRGCWRCGTEFAVEDKQRS